jgi:hypothetical protein
MIFMSPEHVALLNEHARASPEIRAACARLPRDVVLAYKLSDEDSGALTWWQSHYHRAEGISLVLGEPTAPVDAVTETGYWAMIEQTEAMIRGNSSFDAVAEQAVPQMDPAMAQAMALVGEAHGLAWALGLTIPVDFPRRKGPGA